jgi:hypothetical protein
MKTAAFPYISIFLPFLSPTAVLFVDIDNKKIVRRLNPDASEEEAMEPDNDIVLIHSKQLGPLLKGLEGLNFGIY